MTQKIHKKSKVLFYLMASMFLSVISFGSSLFSKSNDNGVAYADVVNGPGPAEGGPCPSGGCAY